MRLRSRLAVASVLGLALAAPMGRLPAEVADVPAPQPTVVVGGRSAGQDAVEAGGDSRGVRSSSVPAFPGAEGFGADAIGGRRGRVMLVTSLADAGAGTFRECAESSGPRICVFRTSGVIEVHDLVRIDDPYITIAGQTAPGDGITLKSSPEYTRATLKITTHDVVIRGLRVRSGPSMRESPVRRGITIEEGARRIIIDRSSISWATDENVAVTDGVRDVTIQWSIIAEALSHSTHSDGEHSKGLAISGKQFTSSGQTGAISVHHNLLAHNRDRNPRHAGYGVVDLVNNVIYNWGITATEANDAQTAAPLNVVANVYKPGPDRTTTRYEVEIDTADGRGGSVYVKGNIGPNRASDAVPDDRVVHPDEREWLVDAPHPAPPVTTTGARAAYDAVLDGAGAWPRDAVDARIVSDARLGTGTIIDDPAEVGGWPPLRSVIAPRDSDGDGMPDHWETGVGLNPYRDDAAQDRDGDGYTNIEEYINSLLD